MNNIKDIVNAEIMCIIKYHSDDKCTTFFLARYVNINGKYEGKRYFITYKLYM